MTKQTKPQADAIALDCSSSFYSYRGIGFHRTSKGYWFFDTIPSCGNAWSRYATDEEAVAISDNGISEEQALGIMHRMIDRKLSVQMVYKGDLRYR